MDKKEVLKYWLESSENDFSSMGHLFEKGDYSWSLFIGHLVIEKLLKSLYIQNVAQTERLSSLPQIQGRCRRAIVDYARR